MNNPFNNIPSSVDVPETVDKKVISTMTSLTERFEAAVSRGETAAKNQEELTGAMLEILLDDDGSMKDIANTKRFESAMNQAIHKQEEICVRIETAAQSVPEKIEVRLCDEDRNRLDKNFLSWKDVFKLHPWGFISVGAAAAICIIGGIVLCDYASDKKQEYENRIEVLENWYQESADAISFGQFYRENYPKSYREWQNGRWQQDIAYRDSLRRVHSLDRLKRLYEDK